MSIHAPLRAVLFDLDGTLLDTALDFVAVVNRLLAEHGAAPLPAELIRAHVSNGARALVTLAFGIDEQHPAFAAKRQRLLELYGTMLADNTRPFPGIPELLCELQQRRIHWGVVTNKPSVFTLPLLEKMNFQPPCATAICPDHVTYSKPHPEALYLACQQLGCAPAEAVYVGDHRRDIEAGRSAGMQTIAAAYGYLDDSSPIDEWGADAIVNDVGELTQILMRRMP